MKYKVNLDLDKLQPNELIEVYKELIFAKRYDVAKQVRDSVNQELFTPESLLEITIYDCILLVETNYVKEGIDKLKTISENDVTNKSSYLSIMILFAKVQCNIKIRHLEDVKKDLNEIEYLMNQSGNEFRNNSELKCWFQELSGIYARYAGDLTNALIKLESVVEGWNSLNMKERMVSPYLNIAYIHQVKGNLNDAINTCKICLQIGEQIDSPNVKLSSSGNLSLIYWKKGELETALRYANIAIELAMDSSDYPSIAKAKTNKGLILIDAGQVNKAELVLLECLPLFENYSDKMFIAHVYNNLGIIYDIKGNISRSLEYYLKCREIYQELHHGIDRDVYSAKVTHNIAILNRKKGKKDDALKGLKRAYQTFEEIESPIDQTRILYDIVSLLIEMKLLDEANNYLEVMEEIALVSNQPRVKLFYKMAKSEALRHHERLQQRAEAQKILQELIESDIVDYDIKITAYFSLCEILLIELKATENKSILSELDHLFSEISEAAIKMGSIALQIEILVLQSRISLVKGDVNRVYDYLNHAEEILENQNIDYLKPKVDSEWTQLKRNINDWEKMSQGSSSIAELLNQSKIDEYILHVRNSGILERID